MHKYAEIAKRFATPVPPARPTRQSFRAEQRAANWSTLSMTTPPAFEFENQLGLVGPINRQRRRAYQRGLKAMLADLDRERHLVVSAISRLQRQNAPEAEIAKLRETLELIEADLEAAPKRVRPIEDRQVYTPVVTTGGRRASRAARRAILLTALRRTVSLDAGEGVELLVGKPNRKHARASKALARG